MDSRSNVNKKKNVKNVPYAIITCMVKLCNISSKATLYTS